MTYGSTERGILYDVESVPGRKAEVITVTRLTLWSELRARRRREAEIKARLAKSRRRQPPDHNESSV